MTLLMPRFLYKSGILRVTERIRKKNAPSALPAHAIARLLKLAVEHLPAMSEFATLLQSDT